RYGEELHQRTRIPPFVGWADTVPGLAIGNRGICEQVLADRAVHRQAFRRALRRNEADAEIDRLARRGTFIHLRQDPDRAARELDIADQQPADIALARPLQPDQGHHLASPDTE